MKNETMDRPKIAKDIMVTKLATLSPDKDAFKAMGLLLKNRISGAPVIDGDRNFVGVFSEKCGIRVLTTAIRLASKGEDARAKPAVANKLAKHIMVSRLVTLKPDSDVFEGIAYLLKHRIAGAPVVDDERNLLGVFSERYCMKVLIDSAYDQLPTAAVSAFMNTDFGRTITEDTNMTSIAQIFLDTHYRRLPVLHDRKLVGQISRRDVLRVAQKSTLVRDRKAALLYLRELDSGEVAGVDESSLAVRTFMDADAATIDEETDLLSIAQVFLNTNYRRLPVLRDGKLVGQISRRDLLCATHELLAIKPASESSLLYLSSLMERSDAPIR